MAIQIQLRNGTLAAWSASNPILAVGEVGVDTTTNAKKIGDGATTWNSLVYETIISSSYAATASFALNAVTTGSTYPITSSWSLNSISASYAPQIAASTFPFTGSAIITGSLIVTGSILSTVGYSGSLLGTSSWSINSITSSVATALFSNLNYAVTNLTASLISSSNATIITLAVGTGSVQPNYPLFVRRAGGVGSIGLSVNNVPPGSTRDAIFTVLPDNPSVDSGGISFSTHNGAGGPIPNAVFIHANGNVGINTTASAAGNKLEVVGNISASTYTGNSATLTNGLTVSGSTIVQNQLLVSSGSILVTGVISGFMFKTGSTSVMNLRNSADSYNMGMVFGQPGSPNTSMLSNGVLLANGHIVSFTGNAAGGISPDLTIFRSGSGVLQIGDATNSAFPVKSIIFTKKLINAISGAYALTGSDSNVHMINSGSTAQVDYVLPITGALGANYTFTVLTPQILRILANTGSIIYYGITSSISNGNLSSNATGSTVSIACMDITATPKVWATVSSIGNWTVT